MAWILLIPALGNLFPSPIVEPLRIDVKEANLSVSLPALGARSSGSGRPAKAGRKSRGSASEARPASSQPGFTFLGPQPIVVESQRPDSLIQTVRQPDIPKPPKLQMAFDSPNILQVAAPAAPVLAKQPTVVDLSRQMNRGVQIPVHTRTSDAVPRAKLTLPAAGSPTSSVSGLMTSTATPQLATAPPAPAPVTGSGMDRRNLLVLNAMPAVAPPPQIPSGELAGSFSVSPEGSPGTSAGTSTTSAPGAGSAGSSSGTESGKAPGTGSGKGSASSGRDASGATTAGAGSGNSADPSGGLGGPNSNGSGVDAGLNGRGSGAAGIPTGSGGPGNSAFSGVSIGGATPPAGASGAPPRQALPRGAYGMTIISTSGSGGGLGDYGVFKNEIVYTVYVDLADPEHARPKWTLQYAGTNPSATTSINPPFPTAKEYPRLPQQLLARNIGRKLVVTGLITRDGKFDALRVIQSPNPLLIQPLLDSLAKWTFQAAEVNGEQVGVRFVLGIPITLELINGN
ncbi:MAG TPA: energy transducer TonB [Candidatus Angelobacter sp.]|nr:energy transducer TonB [Candidatus Angelobacter sp.]